MSQLTFEDGVLREINQIIDRFGSELTESFVSEEEQAMYPDRLFPKKLPYELISYDTFEKDCINLAEYIEEHGDNFKEVFKDLIIFDVPIKGEDGVIIDYMNLGPPAIATEDIKIRVENIIKKYKEQNKETEDFER